MSAWHLQGWVLVLNRSCTGGYWGQMMANTLVPPTVQSSVLKPVPPRSALLDALAKHSLDGLDSSILTSLTRFDRYLRCFMPLSFAHCLGYKGHSPTNKKKYCANTMHNLDWNAIRLIY